MVDDQARSWSNDVINSVATIRDDDILGPGADLDAQCLLECILASEPLVRSSARQAGRRPHGNRRRVRVPLSLAAVAAAVAVLVLLLVVPGPSGPRSAAAAVLEQAATVAAQQATPSPGQYLYTETQTEIHEGLYEDNSETATAVVGETDQSWTDAAGVGHDLLSLGTPDYPTAADETAWAASTTGLAPTMLLGNNGQAQTTEPIINVSGLPTDPTELAAVIADQKLPVNASVTSSGLDLSEEGGASILDDGRPYTVPEAAAALLIGPTTGMTPSLASALFQVLADQPGVQLLGTVIDHDGQQGQGVALPTVGYVGVSEVVVDPASGQLLEARFTLPQSTFPPAQSCTGPANKTTITCAAYTGKIVSTTPMWTDVVAQGVVGSTTATVPATGTVQPTATLMPAAPTGLVANALSGGGVQLSWTAPTDTGGGPVTDYVINQVHQEGSVNAMSSDDTKSPATTYVWLDAGKDSTFTVQAVNAGGYGPASSPATASP